MECGLLNKELHIALATDEGYLRQTLITIISVMTHSLVTLKYHFYVLYNDSNIELLNRYVSLIENQYRNIIIDKIDVSENIHTRICSGHITATTLARLFLPQLLPNVSKCIYLDSDVIVNFNIKELYDINLGDKWIAGVKAANYHNLEKKQEQEYLTKTGLESMKQYINAGVLLMDLNCLREAGFTEKSKILSEKELPSRDQDIINILCYDKILHLHPQYNVTHSIVDKFEKPLWVFSKNEIEEAKEKPLIIHYTTSAKPWNMIEIDYSQEWWKICINTPFFNYYSKDITRDLVYYFIHKNNSLWNVPCYTDKWYKSLSRNKKINVYGYGSKGVRIINRLIYNKIQIKQIIVTSRKNITDIEYLGIPIVEYKHDLTSEDIVLVATTRLHQLDIKDTLYNDNVSNVYFMA